MGWTLVTGGSRRLGAAISISLAAKGYPVLIHYRQQAAEAEEVARKCRLLGVQAETISGELTTPDSTRALIETCMRRYSPIRHLINNAGDYLCKPALETSIEEWLRLFQSNLHAPFMLAKGLLPGIKQLRGSIVNLGVAGASIIQADLHCTGYRMAKMSLYMLTKSLARELAPDQVRVNMISPGYLENSVDLPAKWPVHSMQRSGLLEEVVRVILFLISEESKYITGQNIEVAGGVAL